MIVRENIRFVRGLDPKTATGVGIYRKILNPKISDFLRYPEKTKVMLECRDTYSGSQDPTGSLTYMVCMIIINDGKEFLVSVPSFWEDTYDEALKSFDEYLEGNHLWGSRTIEHNVFGRRDIISMQALNLDVNESLDFQRGLDPKEVLEVGKRSEIISWFNYIESKRNREISYKIETDLSIFVWWGLRLFEIPEIDYIPDNMTISGNLNMAGCNVKTLPKGLDVGGFLDIRGTKITSLPPDLKVGGKIYKDF